MATPFGDRIRRQIGTPALVLFVSILLAFGLVGGSLVGHAGNQAASSSQGGSPTRTPPLPSGTPVLPTASVSATVEESSSAPSADRTASARPTSREQLEAGALAQLHRQAAHDADRVPLDGRIGVQLSSKYVGVRDNFQTPASGGAAFQATDIWAEYVSLKDRLPKNTVILVHRGSKLSSGQGRKLWYVLIVDDFRSKERAQAFCDREFSELSKEARANQCLPRRFT